MEANHQDQSFIFWCKIKCSRMQMVKNKHKLMWKVKSLISLKNDKIIIA
jgi:hypothetical protein